ncbi:ADP-ribosylation factor-like protein 13A [Eublepharis macularius]|uniref:ADP-ribosylation factor-like protein 13A n=1 Tax=Eublepharis macularius TaxID=481883 RepID=A0AA97LF48_EUBMA|nr:ADP-ribosylation factor-like protein 13A [Eublepharis macularius]
MFHLLAYCWSRLQAIQEPLRKVTLLVVGLDGAGKSSLVREIQRVLSCQVLPTTKPNQTELRVDRFEVSLIDLAGEQRTWKNHYSAAHGIIFVLDSGDVAQMDEVKKILARVLGHPKVSGKPLLLLANKQDQLDALLPCEIIECLSLEKLVNESKSPCRIEPCSTTKRLPKTQCWTIVQGLHWLLRTIALNYGVLCDRIRDDGLEPQALPEWDVSWKARRPQSKTREDREPPTKRENFQEGNAKTEESKPPKHSENILSRKEEKTTAPKKRKRKVKLKMKKKGLVQSQSTLAEDDNGKTAASGGKGGAIGGLIQSNRVAQENPRGRKTSPTPAGQNTKKRKKMLKNKIKTKEQTETRPNENISSTFDLYRRAMLALKMQQEGQKTHSASIS